MGVNKVIFGGSVKIDLSNDSVTPDKLMLGVTAHDKSGDTITGTAEVKVENTTLIIPEWMVIPNG